MAGWVKNDHWSAPHFDAYGFRRSELKMLAEKLGMDLSIPLEEVTPTISTNVDSKPLSEADVEILRMEVDSLRKQIRKLENERPILIKNIGKMTPFIWLFKSEIRNGRNMTMKMTGRPEVIRQQSLKSLKTKASLTFKPKPLNW